MLVPREHGLVFGGGPRVGRISTAAGAGINVVVVSDTLNTTTGTQDFTSTGFGTPKAAIIYGFSSGAGGSNLFSFGVTDGTNQWCAAWSAENNQATTDTRRFAFTTKIVCTVNVGAGTLTEAAFDSFITDGIRINITKAEATARRIVIVLFNGDDLSADAGTFTGPTDGNTVTVSPGFETNALFIGRSNNTFDAGEATVGVIDLGFGSFDGSTVLQCSVDHSTFDASASGDPRSTLEPSAIQAASDNSWNATLENITSTSFDIRANGLDTSILEFGYLAINLAGGNAWAGVLDAPTSTGNHTFTDPGFQPNFGIIMPTMFSVTNVARTNAEAGAFGLASFDGSEEWCGVWTDEDAADPTNCSCFVTNQAIDLNTDAGAAAFDATFSTFTSQGVTLNFTAADGTTRKWPALFIGK